MYIGSPKSESFLPPTPHMGGFSCFKVPPFGGFKGLIFYSDFSLTSIKNILQKNNKNSWCIFISKYRRSSRSPRSFNCIKLFVKNQKIFTGFFNSYHYRREFRFKYIQLFLSGNCYIVACSITG